MTISVGTFNLNNLFSRFNFTAAITPEEEKNGITFAGHTDIEKNSSYKIRAYLGKLVQAKDSQDTAIIAERIKRMNIDVLAVQEVEDRDTLREFNTQFLDNLYPCAGLIEGNDPRLIDVGILSKLPLGGLTSWQFAIHPGEPGRPVFSRDVLEVEILNPARTDTLFKFFINHLKSQFVDFRTDPEEGAKQNNTTRKHQAEMLAKIIKHRTRPGSAFIIAGDMNDAVDSEYLFPFTRDKELSLVNALTSPVETQPFKEEVPVTAWTTRFKPSGKPAQYSLFDQIWLSPHLAEKQKQSFIDRRTLTSGDGTDHDPAWVVMEM